MLNLQITCRSGNNLNIKLLKLLTNIVLVLMFSLSGLYGQTADNDRFLQVTGFIIDEANRPVQGAAIISVKLHKGTISEPSGIYSITSVPGDTILFRALGYKKYHTIIPVTYEHKLVNVDIMLEPDTIQIAEVTIMPWRTYAEFIKDMTKEQVKDPIIENMNDNLASIYVAIANDIGVRITPEAGFKYAMEQNFSAMSMKNQVPTLSLLNPFAWSQFINGVKKGLFKSQKFNKPVRAKPQKKKKK